jgi:hypothetical protein
LDLASLFSRKGLNNDKIAMIKSPALMGWVMKIE